MGCCSSTDSKDCCSSGDAGSCCSSSADANVELEARADRLAVLLAETPEYQEFARLGNQVNADPGVRQILLEVRKQNMLYADPQGPTLQALYDDLEALPIVQTYRAAERAAQNLFRLVDDSISEAAGVAFAPNAVRSGCG